MRNGHNGRVRLGDKHRRTINSGGGFSLTSSPVYGLLSMSRRQGNNARAFHVDSRGGPSGTMALLSPRQRQRAPRPTRRGRAALGVVHA